jgi:hypothetical protein
MAAPQHGHDLTQRSVLDRILRRHQQQVWDRAVFHQGLFDPPRRADQKLVSITGGNVSCLTG